MDAGIGGGKRVIRRQNRFGGSAAERHGSGITRDGVPKGICHGNREVIGRSCRDR